MLSWVHYSVKLIQRNAEVAFSVTKLAMPHTVQLRLSWLTRRCFHMQARKQKAASKTGHPPGHPDGKTLKHGLNPTTVNNYKSVKMERVDAMDLNVSRRLSTYN